MKIVLMSAFAALMFWLVAGVADANGFGDDAQWELSEDSSICDPAQTGRVCAEWRSETENFGLMCCVEPADIGSTDLTACVEPIGGQVGFVPDRDGIE